MLNFQQQELHYHYTERQFSPRLYILLTGMREVHYIFKIVVTVALEDCY